MKSALAIRSWLGAGGGDPNAPPQGARFRARLHAMWFSLLFAFVLLAMKLFAYALTGSNAVRSDAFESIVNVAASMFALYTVWLALQPADASHPYGHGKAEAFSAVFEGGLIVLAASAILWAAVPALWSPAPLAHLDFGLILVSMTGAANLVVGRVLVRIGRETRSMALEADGKHLLSDSMTTASVVAGLAVVRITGWLWVDGLVAIIVALLLLRVGTALVQRAVANLMDEADPETLSSIAGALARARLPVMIEVHNLRSWRGGDIQHVDFHLTLPRFLELEESHRIVHDVESIVREMLRTETDVIIHLDPCVPDCCAYCGYEPCPVRAAPCSGLPDWNIEALVKPAEYQRASGDGRQS